MQGDQVLDLFFGLPENRRKPYTLCASWQFRQDSCGSTLRSAKWIAQRSDANDEDVISFTLGRLDSARSSLGQVVREWRRARRGAERGDPAAMMAFRNTVLGLPACAGKPRSRVRCCLRLAHHSSITTVPHFQHHSSI